MGCAITELKKGCSDSEVQTDIGATYEEMQEAHDFFCLVSCVIWAYYRKLNQWASFFLQYCPFSK